MNSHWDFLAICLEGKEVININVALLYSDKAKVIKSFHDCNFT